jgi:serine/threonine protein kinase
VPGGAGLFPALCGGGRAVGLGRVVAIKVLPAHVASDPQVKQRFEREARTLATLSHPHICPVFDVGRQGDTRLPGDGVP